LFKPAKSQVKAAFAEASDEGLEQASKNIDLFEKRGVRYSAGDVLQEEPLDPKKVLSPDTESAVAMQSRLQKQAPGMASNFRRAQETEFVEGLSKLAASNPQKFSEGIKKFRRSAFEDANTLIAKEKELLRQAGFRFEPVIYKDALERIAETNAIGEGGAAASSAGRRLANIGEARLSLDEIANELRSLGSQMKEVPVAGAPKPLNQAQIDELYAALLDDVHRAARAVKHPELADAFMTVRRTYADAFDKVKKTELKAFKNILKTEDEFYDHVDVVEHLLRKSTSPGAVSRVVSTFDSIGRKDLMRDLRASMRASYINDIMSAADPIKAAASSKATKSKLARLKAAHYAGDADVETFKALADYTKMADLIQKKFSSKFKSDPDTLRYIQQLVSRHSVLATGVAGAGGMAAGLRTAVDPSAEGKSAQEWGFDVTPRSDDCGRAYGARVFAGASRPGHGYAGKCRSCAA